MRTRGHVDNLHIAPLVLGCHAKSFSGPVGTRGHINVLNLASSPVIMSMLTTSPRRSQWLWPLVLGGHVDVVAAGLLGGKAPPINVVAAFLLLLLLPVWPFLLQLLTLVLGAPVLEPDFHLATHTEGLGWVKRETHFAWKYDTCAVVFCCWQQCCITYLIYVTSLDLNNHKWFAWNFIVKYCNIYTDVKMLNIVNMYWWLLFVCLFVLKNKK